MNAELDEAITKTLSLVRTNSKSEDALRFSQAALNLTNAKKILEEIKQSKGA